MSEEYEQVNATFWKPTEPGDSLVGRVLDATHKTQNGMAHVVETEEGTKYLVGQKAVQELLADAVGKDVKLVYRGEKVGASGNKYKLIDVFVKKEAA